MKIFLFIYLSVSFIALLLISYIIVSSYMQLKYSLDPLNLQDITIEEIYEIGKRNEIRRLYIIGGYVIISMITSIVFYKKIK